MSDSDTPLLELRGATKRFGAITALSQVDFKARRGEIMALVGDNGAGKSTLIKGVAGIYGFEEGEVFFDGKPVHITSPRDSAALGIKVVYQDLALADNLDVVANMFLGRERINRPFRLNESSMELECINTLNSLAVTTLRSVRQPVASLSGGQRQIIAIAKATMGDSKVIILDEPTAALGVAQTRQVLNLVQKLAHNGLAVVLISHNLHDIFEVADRITVLRLGHKVEEFYKPVDLPAGRWDQTTVVKAITAGKLSAVPGMKEAVE